MKRPAGPAARPNAPDPSRPATPRRPERRSTPAGETESRSGVGGAAGAPSAPAEPDALTEPITLPRSRKKSTPAKTTPPDNKLPKTLPDTTLPDTTLPHTDLPHTALLDAALVDAALVDTTLPDAAPRDAPLTARAARKRLRAARRARKQYERSEVRRFTSRSRHRRNLWIGAAGTLFALVAFVLVGIFSPLMALRTIEITGTDRIPAADVALALEGQLGTPLPLLDLDEVKLQLSEFSLIRSFVTESRPPDTLVVRIVEREPVGAIASAAGFDLVDAAGVVIQSSPERPAGYPVIDAAGGASGAGFQAGVAVVGALPEGIRAQLDTATAATKDDVTLTLAGGARVVWGNAERSEYKAVVLAALIVSHPVGSVTEYDVSSPDSAVVR